MASEDDVPLHLGHTPLFAMTGYSAVDGPYADDSDAKGLSVGLAQWDSWGPVRDLAVKVWRRSEKKWSRLSEELPPHRAMDLATLFLLTWLARRRGTAVETVNVAPLHLESRILTGARSEKDMDAMLAAMDSYLKEHESMLRTHVVALHDAATHLKNEMGW